MNNMNIFQKRAQERTSDAFSNSTPKPEPTQAETPFTLEVAEEVKPEGNIFQRFAAQNEKKKEDKFDFWDTAKDIGQQVLKKGAAGIAGAYGNILDAFGLQVPEGQLLPGQEAIYGVQSDILEKMNRGEAPSFGELMLLSDDDEFGPRSARLPTSKEVEGKIQQVTGVGEGRTPAGRIAGHGAGAVGEGIATGSGLKGALGLLASNSGAQGIRESGGPEALATALEIGGPLATSAIQGKLNPQSVTKAGKETNKLIEGARKLGLAESEITPLIQSPRKTATLAPFAKKSERSKELFGKIKQKLGDSYDTIKSSPVAKNKLPREQQIALRKEFGDIRNDLTRTLSPSAEKQAAIDYIEKALTNLREVEITPEYLVNFWQDVNRTVDWNKIGGGKKALSRLKAPISDVLEKISPTLAKDFDLTNQLYSKYAAISKKLKPDIVDAFLNKAELVGYVPATLALANGNPWALAGLGTETALRIMAREMLINPYFQNIGTKLVKNMNQGSLQGTKTIVNQVKEYMQRKHPNEKWEFLTEEITQ